MLSITHTRACCCTVVAGAPPLAKMADEVEDAKKDLDQLGFETKAFEALERDFQEVCARHIGHLSGTVPSPPNTHNASPIIGYRGPKKTLRGHMGMCVAREGEKDGGGGWRLL